MDNYIDVNFDELNSERPKQPELYYSIGDVAKEIGEESSTIRYWSNKYHDLLDVELQNTHRRYSKLDIQKLKIVQKCKQKNMTHNQIITALKENDFGIDVVEKNFYDNQTPLDVQVFSAALAVEFENKLKDFEDRIISKISENLSSQLVEMEKIKESISQEVATTVDEVVTEVLNDKVATIKEDFKETNQEVVEMRKQLYELKMAFVKPEEIKPVRKGILSWFNR